MCKPPFLLNIMSFRGKRSDEKSCSLCKGYRLSFEQDFSSYLVRNDRVEKAYGS
jgi:hypothetical protein